jgi:LmbE family N-acetylglucosaminyl deacetylase
LTFGLWSLGAALLPLVSRPAASQERGAAALGEAVLGLGVNTRVLVIGAHPDDEDTFLIAWLSRGRHVETAYLSLTRGDGGQNLIGNELGEALGVVRTEELVAARRIDGARQYFTRAYDFGFSKDTTDTYKHWPREQLLGDVVTVVRAFRPHVIVAVFSGTTRDGHGQHQVSGLLAREAYELSGDETRFPPHAHGASWTPLKFYRAARFNPAGATLSFDVGEFSPLLGRSYAEIAGESRSQHKSQGFGAPQRKGPILDHLRREASRVNEASPAASERSLFDGIDTTWARFRSSVTMSAARAALDSLPASFAAVRTAYDPLAPSKLLLPLARLQRMIRALSGDSSGGDLSAAVAILGERLNRALRLAAGVEVDAFAQREVHPAGRTARVVASTYNRGREAIVARGRQLPPSSAISDTLEVAVDTIAQPWWLRTPRAGAMFTQRVSRVSETLLGRRPAISMFFKVGNSVDSVAIVEPVVFRAVDAVKGEIRQQVAGAPAISVTLDQQVQYAPANTPFDRTVEVHVRSADEAAREVRVSLALPEGLTTDSAFRTARLERYDARQTMTFRVRGRLAIGEHRLSAIAESGGETYSSGYDLIDYDHIRRQRLYRPAVIRLVAVDARAARGLSVAYISGVSDNIAPTLAQLGVALAVIPAAEVARTDLRPYSTVVIGPRAYEAHPALSAANPRLLAFVRAGGTLVVQYGQFEMTQPGIMPYPITLSRPADRVTHEDAPVAILDANARELRTPNPIGAADFAGWVQERALYMPRSFDERYRTLLAMSDPGEPPNRGAILVAALGAGTYVYTTLSFFRQLPAGVPGAARLFLNLLSARTSSLRTTP